MKFFIALYFAKLIKTISRFFKKGSGFVWPGHVALWMYPDILNDRRLHFSKGIILISGTNGKTTTSKLITHLLRSLDYNVVTNDTGANLLNGIVSTCLLNTNLLGRFSYDYGVFEVDEFSLPIILSYFDPSVLVLLNLSRDQLDRHGEVDIIFDKWCSALSKLKNTYLVLYKDQPSFKRLSKTSAFSGNISFFDGSPTYLSQSSLKGSFNEKNINASFLTFTYLLTNPHISYRNVKKITPNEIEAKFIKALKTFKSAYGRGEVMQFKNKEYQVYLAKNPASFNNNLPLLDCFDPTTTALLFILNDNIPDGRDVSWIYDINSKSLHKGVSKFIPSNIYVSGTRFLDMAIRLKYASIFFDLENIDTNLKNTLLKISQNEDVSNVLVFPNYSAMLRLRKLIVGRSIL